MFTLKNEADWKRLIKEFPILEPIEKHQVIPTAVKIYRDETQLHAGFLDSSMGQTISNENGKIYLLSYNPFIAADPIYAAIYGDIDHDNLGGMRIISGIELQRSIVDVIDVDFSSPEFSVGQFAIWLYSPDQKHPFSELFIIKNFNFAKIKERRNAEFYEEMKEEEDLPFTITEDHKKVMEALKLYFPDLYGWLFELCGNGMNKLLKGLRFNKEEWLIKLNLNSANYNYYITAKLPDPTGYQNGKMTLVAPPRNYTWDDAPPEHVGEYSHESFMEAMKAMALHELVSIND